MVHDNVLMIHFLFLYFIFMYMPNNHCHRVIAHLQLNILFYIYYGNETSAYTDM